ncbi:MAG: DUF72 domain-containing protein [Candidatus Dormibacteraeota bacterium]|nr:DUF72 domain-containing protein [Candidatus Dormibacteraeota bacterium]MBO0761905.1 DUF72 domain-containing protein [Candidatus Dormibacteraeota bacterium]
MLSFYAQRLNGVELNATFYRTPRSSTLVKWAADTPATFRLCCKGHRALTYSGPAFDKEAIARSVASQLATLGPRLGPVLLQFPPPTAKDAGLLERVLTALDVRAAVEFRNASWFAEDVYDVLRRHGAALVVTDGERWPEAPRLDVGPVAYYRLRREDYDRARLRWWRDQLREESTAREVHVYFRHVPAATSWARVMLESA